MVNQRSKLIRLISRVILCGVLFCQMHSFCGAAVAKKVQAKAPASQKTSSELIAVSKVSKQLKKEPQKNEEKTDKKVVDKQPAIEEERCSITIFQYKHVGADLPDGQDASCEVRPLKKKI